VHLLASAADNLVPARAQMALSLGWHIILACLGVGLPALILVAEWRGLRGDADAMRLARRWSQAAGVLFAVGNRLSGLDGVDWHTSGKVVIMTILGGIGTVFGPLVGAGIYESLDYFVSKTPIGDKTNIVMGTIFALCVLLFRRGIVGELLALRTRPKGAPPS